MFRGRGRFYGLIVCLLRSLRTHKARGDGEVAMRKRSNESAHQHTDNETRHSMSVRRRWPKGGHEV